MREMLGDFINQILPAQADTACGAFYGTTSDNRVNHRNGYRHRLLDTRVGTVDVAIPKLRHGSFFPWAVSNIVDGRTLDYGAWWQITFLPNHTGWNPGCLPNGGQAPRRLRHAPTPCKRRTWCQQLVGIQPYHRSATPLPTSRSQHRFARASITTRKFFLRHNLA